MAFDPNTVRRDYGDPELEAYACRTDCALFDYSFIGRARLDGPGALEAIGQLTRRPLTGLLPGQIRYALRADSNGHLLSDLTVWKHGKARYEVMSGRSEDIPDLVLTARPGCEVEDLSARMSMFAVQGPGSLQAVAVLMDVGAIAKLGYFTFVPIRICDVDCLVGRLGYTGEPGFEILLPRPAATEFWQLLARRARPAGFAAADMLRIEAGFVLFANEFRLPVTAREACLERFAGWCGAPEEPEISLVCFRANTPEKPVLWRPRAPLVRPTGSGMITVTSACHSLKAGGTLGLGYALRSDLLAGAPLHDPTGAFADIRLAPLPFFDPQKRRPRTPWSVLAQGK
jgi:glycine cleavage system T protein (aminomethyltransferase)